MVFNSDEYAYADMSVQIGDRVIAGLRGISYDDKIDKELIYGSGSEPRAIGHGNASYEGEVRMLQSELQLLIRAAPNKDLKRQRNLTMIVSFERDGVLATDRLTGVEFMNVQKALEQGAKMMEVTLPIIFLGVKHET